MKNKIQHIISAMALIFVLSYTANAQVTAQKIGANPTNIAPSAVLDIESANKGVLFPRVALTSTTDATTIASPAEGLTIYNTATAGTAPNNVTPGYYYWNGTKWTKVATESESSKWTYDAIKSRVNLAKLANGTTARTGATSFGVHDNNILQIGDMTDISGAAGTDKSIVTRKTGNNTILNVSEGGIKSMLANEIYGGTDGAAGAYLELIKHRGTAASPQIVQNGDLIGYLDFKAGTGSGTNYGARFRVGVDGAVTTTSTPMRISFETAAEGQTWPTQRFQIGSNGNVAIGTNATANAAAILDVASSSKGVLLPRVALTSTSLAGPITSPVNGLTVFNTATAGTAPNNVTPGYYYWNSSRWVKLAIETPPVAFAKTVYVNTPLPGTATIFDETNPPATNNDALKAKDDNLYIGNDGSTWTYDNVNAAYETYAVAPSTPFYLGASTTDAGNDKISTIWRAGSIGIGTNAPISTFANTSSRIQATTSHNSDNGLAWSASGAGFAGSFYSQAGNGLVVKTAGITNATNAFEVSTGTQTGATNPLFNVLGNGNVGVGTTAPTSRLEVNGSATNTNAFNAGSGTTIDFSRSNLAYTTANPGAFNLSNIKDGGTYTLAVRGTTAGTAGFTATGFTFKSPNNGLTAANTETLYTFMVIGSTVYFYMTTGL